MGSTSDIEAREERIKRWFQEQLYAQLQQQQQQIQRHYDESQIEALKGQNAELHKLVLKMDSRCKKLLNISYVHIA
jgi:hypothetical protein